jgi:hypothetical protein
VRKLLFLLLVSLPTFAQTGIGTATPDASAKLEVSSSNKGFLPPRVTLTSDTDVSTIASPAVGLLVYNLGSSGLRAGYCYWTGTNWATIVVSSGNIPTPGDVKSGFQTADHYGWVKLNGRTKSSLTASQQAAATSLGFGTNLPDASNTYLSQNGSSMGAVSGSNTVTLTQANLPSINFFGSTGNAGNHAHNVDPAGVYTADSGNHYHDMYFNNDDYNGSGGGNQSLEDDGGGWQLRNTNWSGTHSHYYDVPNTTSTTNGDHAHTVTVASGGSGTAITVAPRTLSVTMFIYLGL